MKVIFSIYGRGASLPLILLNEPVLGAVCRKLLFESRKGMKLRDDSRIILTADSLKRILELYAALGIIKREKTIFVTNVPIFSKNEKVPFMNMARRFADDLVSYVIRHLKEVRAKFEKSSLPTRGYKWDNVIFIFLAGMLLDYYFFMGLHEVGILPYPPLRPDGGRWYLWALEEGTGSSIEYWTQVTESPEGGYAIIWIRGITRDYISMDLNKLRLLLFIAEKPRTIDELVYELALPREYVSRVLDEWRIKKFINIKEGRINTQSLVFLKADIGIIRAIRRMGLELADSIVRRKVIEILKLKYRLGYEHFEDESYLAMMFHAMKNYAVEKLIKKGIIPPPPKVMEASWGFWAWSRG